VHRSVERSLSFSFPSFPSPFFFFLSIMSYGFEDSRSICYFLAMLPTPPPLPISLIRLSHLTYECFPLLLLNSEHLRFPCALRSSRFPYRKILPGKVPSSGTVLTLQFDHRFSMALIVPFQEPPFQLPLFFWSGDLFFLPESGYFPPPIFRWFPGHADTL